MLFRSLDLSSTSGRAEAQQRLHNNTMTADDLTEAEATMNAASFVGITEHYVASVCLLFPMLSKRPLPEWCACNSTAVANVTHDTHGVDSSVVVVTPEDEKLIAQLTQNDARLYEAGLRRFTADLEAANMTCLLDARVERRAPAGRSHGDIPAIPDPGQHAG